MKKLLLIISSLILVVIIAAFVLIKFYITPERVKAFVVPTVEKALNRKIDIGEIDINIFEGIGLKDFAVKEADNKSDFLKCEEFVMKFKLIPLFSKQVIIDEIRLVSPDIIIRRDRNGKFNFEDIGKKEVQAPVEEEITDDSDGELPVSLLVDNIVFRDARVSLVDLKKELPEFKSTTDINIRIESAGTSKISSSGSIDITLDEITMKGSKEGPLKDLKAALQYDVLVNLDTFDLQIAKADLKVQDIPASITGVIKNLKDSAELDLAVSLPRVEIAKLQKAASAFVKIDGLGLSGGISADLKLKGKPGEIKTMQMNGNIALAKVGVSYEDIDALLEGELKFSEKVMNLNIDTTVGRNRAELKGSVRNYFDNQEIQMDLYSKKLYIDEVIPLNVSEVGTTKKDIEKKTAAKEADALELKLMADGTVRIDSAFFKGMTMSDFRMEYSFRDNKLRIPTMTANAGKGKFDLKGVIDLSKPGYRYDLTSNVDSLHADEVVNALFPKAKETLFGILSLDLKLQGAGTLPGSIKKNLVGNGNFNVIDGKMTDVELTKKLSGFLDINRLETIYLRKASGKVDIKNGIARLDSIFISDDIEMDPKGNIGLDETLDLAFDLKLSSSLTEKAALNANIVKHMKNEQGWGVIPLKISGTFSKPSYSFDMKKAGERVIRKEAEKFLDKIFKVPEQENVDKTGQVTDPVQKPEPAQESEPVQELIKGLFR